MKLEKLDNFDETLDKNMKLIKETYAKDSTEQEFKLFLYMARTYKLDPLLKKIWLVKYGSYPAQIFTGRDGFLDIAHRSKKFDGLDTEVKSINEPFEVIDKKGNFVAKYSNQFIAKCTVYRTDASHPFISTVYESEYSTGKALWKTHRRTMIGKVAESQALRKAFNITGLYSPEEMPEEKIINPQKTVPPKKAPQITTIDNGNKNNLPEDIINMFQQIQGITNAIIIRECKKLDWDESKIKLMLIEKLMEIEELKNEKTDNK